jgi:hypothetical protein
LIFAACSRYNSIEDFRSKKDEDKVSFIKEILKKHNLDNFNSVLYPDDGSTLKYMQYVLDTDKYYQALLKVNHEANFDKFLDQSIQTLFYAFNQRNYNRADSSFRKLAKGFLLNAYDNQYGCDEAKFRAFLSKFYNQHKDPTYFMVFDFRWNSGNEAIAYHLKDGTLFLNHEFWVEECSFKDFAKLSPAEQSGLISSFVYIDHDFYDLDAKTIKEVGNKWGEKYQHYLTESPEFSKLDINTNFKIVLKKIKEVTVPDIKHSNS